MGWGSSFCWRRWAYSWEGFVNRPVVTTIPRFGPSKSNVAIAEWSFWTTGRPTVSVCLHSTMIARRVPSTTSSMMTSRPLVGGSLGLTDVLIAEISEDVLYHVLELKP